MGGKPSTTIDVRPLTQVSDLRRSTIEAVEHLFIQSDLVLSSPPSTMKRKRRKKRKKLSTASAPIGYRRRHRSGSATSINSKRSSNSKTSRTNRNAAKASRSSSKSSRSSSKLSSAFPAGANGGGSGSSRTLTSSKSQTLVINGPSLLPVSSPGAGAGSPRHFPAPAPAPAPAAPLKSSSNSSLLSPPAVSTLTTPNMSSPRKSSTHSAYSSVSAYTRTPSCLPMAFADEYAPFYAMAEGRALSMQRLALLVLSYMDDCRTSYIGRWIYEFDNIRSDGREKRVVVDFSEDGLFEVEYTSRARHVSPVRTHSFSRSRRQRDERRAPMLSMDQLGGHSNGSRAVRNSSLDHRKGSMFAPRPPDIYEKAYGIYEVRTISSREYYPPRRLPCIYMQYDALPRYQGTLFPRLVLHPSDSHDKPDVLCPTDPRRRHVFQHIDRPRIFFGWMRYECDDGTTYYYNAARDDYQWKAPEDLYEEDDSGMFVEPPTNYTPKVTFDIS